MEKYFREHKKKKEENLRSANAAVLSYLILCVLDLPLSGLAQKCIPSGVSRV